MTVLAVAALNLLNAVERTDQPHRPQRIAAAAARLRVHLEDREQLLVDKRTETLLRVWQASSQGGLRDVPLEDLAAVRGLAQQLLETLDFVLTEVGRG